MRATASRITIALACLVLVALAVTMHRVKRAFTPPPPITLTTGEVLTFRGLTYGTNHFAPGQSLWLRFLPGFPRRWVSARFSSPSSLFANRTTIEPELLLWTEATSGTWTNEASRPQTWAMLSDEKGQPAGRRENVSLYGIANKIGLVSSFPALPRRSRELEVVWLQGTWDNAKEVGRWRLPNPGWSSAPAWPAQTLPATQAQGDLEFTLKRVVFGTGHSMGTSSEPGGGESLSFSTAKRGDEVGAALYGVFREKGEVSKAWSIAGVLLKDAPGNGNRLPSGSMSWSPQQTNVCLEWSPVLWPLETWEMVLSAKRTDEGSFAASELVSFPDVELGEVNVPTPLGGNSRSSGGVTIRLSEFVVRNPKRTDGIGSSEDWSHLKLTVAGITNGVYVDLVRAVDQDGKVHKPNGWSSSGSDRDYHFADITAAVRNLSFTFAVQRGREFTFRVQPEMAGAKTVFRFRE